jgi:hypothetical protein
MIMAGPASALDSPPPTDWGNAQVIRPICPSDPCDPKIYVDPQVSPNPNYSTELSQYLLDYGSSTLGAATDLDPTDPLTPAAPTTPADDTAGNATGFEDQPGGGAVGGDAAVSPSLVFYMMPRSIATRLAAGTITVPEATTLPGFYWCGLSFRRRIDYKGSLNYSVDWGARFSCNVTLYWMSFRARLVKYKQDSLIYQYGNLIDKAGKNEYSGSKNTFPYNPHLVVYVTGDLSFPPPRDPKNYLIGVADDPKSVNQGKSTCNRVGQTFTVHCDARSISFYHHH